MLKKIHLCELNAELIAAFVFIVVSASHTINRYGFEKLVNELFFWMFPASVMIFLTLMVVKIIEKYYKKTCPIINRD